MFCVCCVCCDLCVDCGDVLWCVVCVVVVRCVGEGMIVLWVIECLNVCIYIFKFLDVWVCVYSECV